MNIFKKYNPNISIVVMMAKFPNPNTSKKFLER